MIYDNFLGGNCFSVEIVSSRSSFLKRFKLSYCLHLPLFSLVFFSLLLFSFPIQFFFSTLHYLEPNRGGVKESSE